MYFNKLYKCCSQNDHWHEDCDMPCGLRRNGEAAKSAAVRPPNRSTPDGFWQDFTTASVARKRRAHTRHGFRRPLRCRGGNHHRLHLRRVARRLRLQPGPRARRRGAQEDARTQSGRGRKSPGDRRRRKNDGIDDQSRRRDAAVPDIVRILQSSHDQDGEQVSKAALRALRRLVERQGSEERRQLFRLHRRGAIHLRHRRRLLHQNRQARLRRRQADPPGAAQHQCLHARRQARQSEGHHAGDLYRRLVDAGQGSRSDQQPDRSGRRCPDLSRRRTEDDGGERGAPRGDGLRLSRQSVAAGAKGLSDRRRVELGSTLSKIRQDDRCRRSHSEFLSRRLEGRDRQVLALWRGGFGGSAQACRRYQGQADFRRLRHLQGPDHGQQGQNRHRRRDRARPEGSRTRENGLSGGRCDRSDFVTSDVADPADAAAISPAADPGFLQRYGGTIEYILIPGAALVGALGVFGIFVALFGKSPLDLYFYMYQGAFGTWFSWQNTLTRAPPLVVQLAMVAAGMIGGGLWIMLAGGLRQYRGVNETISSLLLVYIALAILNHLVEGMMRDPASLNKPSTREIGAANMIGTIPGTDVHWGLVFGVVAAIASYILIYHTVFGFAARVAGGNIRAAKIVGLGVGKLILTICFLAGASAGLAGMVEVAAVQGRTNANLAAGYGFTGILVAFLARQNPLAVIPVAILLGGISASGGLLQRRLGLPDASVQVLQGMIFVSVLMSETLYGRFRIFRRGG